MPTELKTLIRNADLATERPHLQATTNVHAHHLFLPQKASECSSAAEALHSQDMETGGIVPHVMYIHATITAANAQHVLVVVTESYVACSSSARQCVAANSFVSVTPP